MEYATLLTEINITNSTINDYTGMGKVPNLEVLYLYNINDTEVNNLGSGLSTSKMTTLQYFGIMDSPNLISIDGLANFFSTSVKENIRYMYGNGIINFNIGDGFDSVYELYITENYDKDWQNKTIKKINLANLPNLTDLFLDYCHAYTDLNSLNNFTSLTYYHLKGCLAITSLDGIANNRVKHIDCSECSNLEDISAILLV